MQDLLGKPLYTVFAICELIRPPESGGFDLIGLYDTLVVPKLLEGGFRPSFIPVPVATVWTGGVGAFEQTIALLDEDGGTIMSKTTPFALQSTSERKYLGTVFTIEPRAGTYTLVLSRGSEELARQDFRLLLV